MLTFYIRPKAGKAPEQLRPVRIRAAVWIREQRKQLYFTTDIVLSAFDQAQRLFDKFNPDGTPKGRGSRTPGELRDKLKFVRYCVAEAYKRAAQMGVLDRITSKEFAALMDNVRHETTTQFYQAAAATAAIFRSTYEPGAKYSDSKWSNEIVPGYIWSKKHGLFVEREEEKKWGV